MFHRDPVPPPEPVPPPQIPVAQRTIPTVAVDLPTYTPTQTYPTTQAYTPTTYLSPPTSRSMGHGQIDISMARMQGQIYDTQKTLKDSLIEIRQAWEGKADAIHALVKTLRIAELRAEVRQIREQVDERDNQMTEIYARLTALETMPSLEPVSADASAEALESATESMEIQEMKDRILALEAIVAPIITGAKRRRTGVQRYSPD